MVSAKKSLIHYKNRLAQSHPNHNSPPNTPPSIPRTLIQRHPRPPPQLPLRPPSISNTNPNIPLSPPSHPYRDRPPRSLVHALHNLVHSGPPARPQIVSSERHLRRSLLSRRKSRNMSPCKIDNVDIIAHSSAVASLPIGTKDVQRGSLALEDLCDDGEQIRGLLSRVFAQCAARFAADSRPGHNNNIARSEVILLDWRLI